MMDSHEQSPCGVVKLYKAGTVRQHFRLELSDQKSTISGSEPHATPDTPTCSARAGHLKTLSGTLRDARTAEIFNLAGTKPLHPCEGAADRPLGHPAGIRSLPLHSAHAYDTAAHDTAHPNHLRKLAAVLS